MAKNSTILGVDFFSSGIDGLLNNLRTKNKKSQIVIYTPNPEILLKSLSTPNLRKLLVHSKYNFLDGFGIQLVQFILRKKVVKRITGGQLFEKILEFANSQNQSVVLIGGDQVSSDGSLAVAKMKYPKLKISGVHNITVDNEGKLVEPEAVLQLSNLKPDYIVVALGCPKQELWIERYKNNFPNSVFLTVGGVLDVYSGKNLSAPVAFRKLGLEWVWRLVNEPRRIKRVLNAVLVFPVVAIWYEVTKKRV